MLAIISLSFLALSVFSLPTIYGEDNNGLRAKRLTIKVAGASNETSTSLMNIYNSNHSFNGMRGSNFLTNDVKDVGKMHRITGVVKVTNGKRIKRNRSNEIGVLSQCTNIFQDHDLIKDVRIGANIIMKIGECTFSERFQGQEQTEPRGFIGMSDVLSKEATGPLTVIPNHNNRENLYVIKKCMKGTCGIAMLGRGPNGFKGPGAMSVLFDTDKSDIQLSFRSDGASEAVVLFFKRNGKRISQLDVDISLENKYRFQRRRHDIAGMSIFPTGETLMWHKFRLVGLCHD